MHTIFYFVFACCFWVFFVFLFGYMSHLLHTSAVHITASLADEGNSAYCQSSGAHNIKIYKPMEISMKGSPQH